MNEIKLNYRSVKELIDAAQKEGRKISDIVIKQQSREMECTEKELLREMESRFRIMKEGISQGKAEDLRSVSGLTGGDAFRMQSRKDRGKSIISPLFSQLIANALAVSELNASMGCIIASPTAGSCGILPAVISAVKEAEKLEDDICVKSMFTAGAIGMVIDKNASLAGAKGGCQAECGSGAAMAAGAFVELAGGSPEMVGHAAAIALKNQLGLVCDPVAGLVEVPCIKRNVSGAVIAVAAGEMALAGIESRIPVDEVIIAMKRIGDSMSDTLKETSEGGLAATPTAKKIYEDIFGELKNAGDF